MSKTRGLGKGLSALFQEKIDEDLKSENTTPYQEINIDLLKLNPNQPRKSFSEESINELAISIKNQGLLQPIVVRPIQEDVDGKRYEIVAGERRYRAAKIAGLKRVPVIINELTDEDALVVSLIENLQREDLNCIEQAEALNRIKDLMGITQDELAARVGKSRPHVANLLRILNLEDEIKEALRQGHITQGHGRALLGITDSEHRLIAFRYICKKGLSVRDSEKIANYWNKNKTLPSYCFPKSDKKTKSGHDSFLDNIKKLIKNKIPLKASIRGTIESGSITFKYSSTDELKTLLGTLGIEISKEDVSRETNS